MPKAMEDGAMKEEESLASTELRKREPLQIQFFGSFTIAYGEQKLSNDNSRTKQLWLLLEYLLVNRQSDVSIERLESVLWPGEEIESPANALKNLVYRLRNLLGKVGRTPQEEYIISRSGNYAWNNDLPCVIDIEEFERYYRAGTEAGASEERQIACLSEATELYRGDFLNALSYEEWVVPLCTYYRNLFYDCVVRVCGLLFDKRCYEEVDRICSKAIAIDPFEERIQVMKMHALVAQGKNTQALQHYEYVTSLYYKELGAKPSDEIRTMYRDITKQIKSVEMDLSVIKEDLGEALANASGAYCCDYEVFKNIYRLEARSVERSGQSVFICLFTLADIGGGEIHKNVRERAMENLKDALISSLRRGDVVARFSVTQYVAMLPTVTFENSSVVTKRVTQRFNAACNVRSVILDAKVMPIDPVV